MPLPGEFPVAFAFVEADDALSRGIPPSFAFDAAYQHAWSWLLPGERVAASGKPSLPAATVTEPILRFKPILGVFLSTVEKTLGRPRSVGSDKMRYYKADGFVRIVIKPTRDGHIGTVEFQFAKNLVGDWRGALMRVGFTPTGGEKEPVGRNISFPLADKIGNSPSGWRVHWNTDLSSHDALILQRVVSR